MPERIAGLPNLARLCFDELLAPDYALPDPERALANPPGLAGIVHEFTLPTILAAYRRGLYPLAHIAPMKWWSPPQRSVLFFNEMHHRQAPAPADAPGPLHRHLRPRLRRRDHGLRRPPLRPLASHLDHAQGDARSMPRLFDAGHAHSFEVWNEKGELAGGGYGVAIGGAFVTESQFSHEPNTSKIGFAVLNWHLAHWGFAFNDGKLMTPTCHDMGFRDIPRTRISRAAGAGRAPAGQERALAGRSGCGDGRRLAAAIDRGSFLAVINHVPINGICAIHRPMPRMVLLRLGRSPRRPDRESTPAAPDDRRSACGAARRATVAAAARPAQPRGAADGALPATTGAARRRRRRRLGRVRVPATAPV